MEILNSSDSSVFANKRIGPNSLAHVTDIVSSEKEVLKPLVAHFKHTGKRENQDRT